MAKDPASPTHQPPGLSTGHTPAIGWNVELVVKDPALRDGFRATFQVRQVSMSGQNLSLEMSLQELQALAIKVSEKL